MKRFTATEKWDKAWFQDLPLEGKCLWNYLCDNADAAGVWDANWRLASFQIGATFAAESLAAFGARVEVLDGGRKVWIVGFCDFQYGKLSRECRPQKYVFQALEKHGLMDRVKHLLEPLSDTLPDRVLDTLQDKDKDKEGDKDKEPEGGQGETDPQAKAKAERRAGIAALGQRLGAIFHRQPGSKWSDKEKAAVIKLYPQPDDDVALIERYYADLWPPGNDRNILRHDLGTLLNNWPGELDRARKHAASRPGAPTASATIPPEKIAEFLALPEHAQYRVINPQPTTRAKMPNSMQADWDRWYPKNK